MNCNRLGINSFEKVKGWNDKVELPDLVRAELGLQRISDIIFLVLGVSLLFLRAALSLTHIYLQTLSTPTKTACHTSLLLFFRALLFFKLSLPYQPSPSILSFPHPTRKRKEREKKEEKILPLSQSHRTSPSPPSLLFSQPQYFCPILPLKTATISTSTLPRSMIDLNTLYDFLDASDRPHTIPTHNHPLHPSKTTITILLYRWYKRTRASISHQLFTPSSPLPDLRRRRRRNEQRTAMLLCTIHILLWLHTLSVGARSGRVSTNGSSIDSSSNNHLEVFCDNKSIYHQVLKSELASMPTTGADADDFQVREEEEAEGSVITKPWLAYENDCMQVVSYLRNTIAKVDHRS